MAFDWASAVGGGGGGYSSASASTDVNQRGGAINVGGINTGTQGVDLKIVALIAAGVVLALVLLRKK
jgi:hypothetical protein